MKIKNLMINGLKVERDIINVTYPNEEAFFWQFETKNGGLIYASGNVSFELINVVEGELVNGNGKR
jgi:hypothetical protein